MMKTTAVPMGPAEAAYPRITADELERIAETHDLFTMTPEEERMIFAFREFKLKRHKPGAVFTWQTHPDIQGGQVQSRLVRT